MAARYASEVMSRLATTCSELALNSRYRARGKSRGQGAAAGTERANLAAFVDRVTA